MEEHQSKDPDAATGQEFGSAVSEVSDDNVDGSNDVSENEDDSKGCTLPDDDADALKQGAAALASIGNLHRCLLYTSPSPRDS